MTETKTECPIIPAKGIVVVKPEPWKNWRDGRLVLAENKDSERKMQNIGTVLAIGPMPDDAEALPFEVGDLVIVSRFMEVWPDGPHKPSVYCVDAGLIVGKLTRKARTEADEERAEQEIKAEYEAAAKMAESRPQPRIARLVDAAGRTL